MFQVHTLSKYHIFLIKCRTPNKRQVQINAGFYSAEFKINTPGVYSGSWRLFEMGILNQDFCLNCVLVLFLPFSMNLYTDVQTKLPFTIVLLTRTDKQATHQVSCQSLLSHGIYSVGLIIKRGSPRGSLQRFSRGFLNHSIILLFSELMEQEPHHHLVLNCLPSTFAVEQLPIHFLGVSRRNVTKRRVPSLLLQCISDVF